MFRWALGPADTTIPGPLCRSYRQLAAANRGNSLQAGGQSGGLSARIAPCRPVRRGLPVAEMGFEPIRPCGQGILSPQRLPISPLGRQTRRSSAMHTLSCVLFYGQYDIPYQFAFTDSRVHRSPASGSGKDGRLIMKETAATRRQFLRAARGGSRCAGLEDGARTAGAGTEDRRAGPWRGPESQAWPDRGRRPEDSRLRHRRRCAMR